MNKNVGKFTNAELMSSFCDRLLKSGSEKLSESEIDASLTKIVKLFSYLDDKDLFGEIYRNQLAKRMLNNKSASDDLEKTMISKLKHDVGAQFTSKMEGMINDLATGLEHKKKFEEYAAKQDEKEKSAVNFSVQVLTTGNWPTYKAPEITLPAEMMKCVQVSPHDSILAQN